MQMITLDSLEWKQYVVLGEFNVVEMQERNRIRREVVRSWQLSSQNISPFVNLRWNDLRIR